MKLSTFVMLFLVIAGFMVTFALISQEAKTYYPESNIDDSEWADKYNFADDINQTVQPLDEALRNIGDDDKGWFVKILSGIAAIPKAVIGLVVALFKTIGFGATVITTSFTSLKFAGPLIAIVIVMILVWVIFKLIEVYQRWQI